MYYFIVNPNSRSGVGGQIWKRLSKILDARKIPYKAHLTECRGHAVQLARELSSPASETNIITIIAMGGDGTIQEVLTGLTNLPFIRFGFVPTGSGNDFCRSMGLPRKAEEALEKILSSNKTVSIDVPEISFSEYTSRFAVSCGMGFDAAVCHEVAVSRLKKLLNHIGLGKLAYLLIGLKQLLTLPSASVSVDTDCEIRHSYDKVFLTAIMNQQYEGGGFRFAPRANPSDGLLDVVIIEGIGRGRLVFYLLLSLFGKHSHFPGVHMLRCRNITVQTPTPLAAHTDGEVAGFRKEFTVSLTDKTLQVII